MKKIIYINCFLDPWIKVAEKLEHDYGFVPVYWIGYKEEPNEYEEISSHFPTAIFQYDMDAWRGIFPDIIATKAKESYINVDFVRQYASFENQAMKMLDRLDVDRFRFNFMERQRHVRNLIRSWESCIDLLKPDAVITPMLPHRVYDYVLYMLCQWHHIPYFTFDHTRFAGRYIILNGFYTIGDMFVKDYLDAIEKPDSEIYIPDDIEDCFNKNKQDYKVAAPAYMGTEEKENARWDSIWDILKHTVGKIIVRRKELWGNKGFLKDWSRMYYKESKDISLENSKYPLPIYLKDYVDNNKYKKKMLRYYESLTENPVYSEKYVVYFLHYQPEATTSPTGDVFVDQSLCIDMLLKNLPQDYMVYVKEHPHQFLFHREGHTSRMKYFYDDMKKNQRIRLMSLKEPSFDLIENCKAIGTVCGTVGWESIVRGKPVVLFGVAWYENYDKGVFRVTDEASAKGMCQFIENYRYDEHALRAYLSAVGKNTHRAYYYKAFYKDQLNITEEECVNNMVTSIVEKYEESNKENV